MFDFIDIDIPESFKVYVDPAVARLRYLFPAWEITVCGSKLCIANVEDEAFVRRETNYAFYRERIRAEGAPIRELLLRSVLA